MTDIQYAKIDITIVLTYGLKTDLVKFTLLTIMQCGLSQNAFVRSTKSDFEGSPKHFEGNRNWGYLVEEHSGKIPEH